MCSAISKVRSDLVVNSSGWNEDSVYHYVFDLIILLSDSLMTEHKMIFINYNTSVHLVPSLKIRGLGFEGWLGIYQSEVLQFAVAR